MSSRGGRIGSRGIDLPTVTALTGVLLAVMLVGSRPLARDASNVGLAVAASAAAAASARRALLGSGYRRRAFLLFAAGCGCGSRRSETAPCRSPRSPTSGTWV